MKNKMLKSTIILTLSCIFAKLLGAIYRIPLSNILGTEGIGLYQMVFPLYSLCLVLLTGGISTYLSQKIAYYRARNDIKSAYAHFKSALLICLVYGIIGASLLSGLSFPIASVQGNQMATMGYMAIALSFVFSCLASAYRGYFQGYENMLPTSISQILEQVFKLLFGLLFSYLFLSNGLMWGVFGALLGVSISEIISFIYLGVCQKNHKNRPQYIKPSSQDYHAVIKGFLPISMTSIMMPLMSAFDSFFVVKLMNISGLSVSASTSLFGIYSGMICPILNFPIMICSAVCVVLLPNLAYQIQKKADIYKILKNAFLFVWVFSLPCAGGFIAIASLVLKIFYPVLEASYIAVATLAMQIASVNVVWLSFIAICSSVLQAYGKYNLPCFSLGISFIVKISLTFILSLNPNINIIGLAIINTLTYCIATIINLYFIKKHTNMCLSLIKCIVPLFSAIIMTIILFVVKSLLNINLFVELLIIVFVGVFIYMSFMIFFKIININEIKKCLEKNKKEKNNL